MSKFWFCWISFVCATDVFGTGCTALGGVNTPVTLVDAMLMLTRTLQLMYCDFAPSANDTLLRISTVPCSCAILFLSKAALFFAVSLNSPTQ